MKKSSLILLFILVIIIALIIAEPAFAASYRLKNPIAGITGSASLSESVAIFIGAVIKIILSIAGSVALILFVWGGFLMISSAGSADTINKAKKVLVWTTIGLILVLFSFAMVDFTIQALTGDAAPVVPPTTPPGTTPVCSDGQDNDGDTKIDLDDPGCGGNPDGTSEEDPLPPPPPPPPTAITCTMSDGNPPGWCLTPAQASAGTPADNNCSAMRTDGGAVCCKINDVACSGATNFCCVFAP
ncbi:hypothetical protein ACFL2U_00350 [Patescibacteria group bacterium]